MGTTGDSPCLLFPHVLRMDLFATERGNIIVAAAMALVDGATVASKSATDLLPLPAFDCSYHHNYNVCRDHEVAIAVPCIGFQ